MRARRKKGRGPTPEARRAAASLLSSVPHVNAAVERQRQAEGVLVSVPLERPVWLVPPLSWVIPFSGYRRIQLDELGSEVLELCDGRRTAEQIVEAFAAAHKLTFREGQVPVAQYLGELLKRGVLALVGT